MTMRIEDIIDTSWAAIDSAEDIFGKSTITEHGDGGGFDTSEQEQTFTKSDFERDLQGK